MKHEKKEQILCGSNFSLKSDIIYSEYISKEEFIIQNTKNKQIIFEEKNFVLYKLTEFELFENAIIFCNNLALKSLFKYLNKVTDFKNIKIITHQTGIHFCWKSNDSQKRNEPSVAGQTKTKSWTLP